MLVSSCNAQNAPDLAVQLRKQYENCVYDAVGLQWKGNLKLDPSLGAENAFQACLTEEQAINALLYSLNTHPAQITTVLVGIKLKLKRTIREIMADPAKYKREHGG